MRRSVVVAAAAVAMTLLVTFSGIIQSASGESYSKANRYAPSGTYSSDPSTSPGVLNKLSSLATTKTPVRPHKRGTSGCRDHSATNVRANQECTNQSLALGRSQSQNETAVAVNPRNPNNILISQNDYRRGDGACGVDFSKDGGRHWGSELAPAGFTLPGFTAARHYWDASGDTSVAFDSRGEAYLMCQVFNRGTTSDLGGNASAFLLFRSADGGASWSFPGSIVTESDGTGADGIGLLDKEYMTVDNNPNSPNRDRIYVAWTQFSTTFASAPIHFAYSDNHGATWHQSGNIIADSPTLCPISFSGAPAGTCDSNLYVQPFVDSKGHVYVVTNNYNNCAGAIGTPCTGDASDNHNQILLVKSIDGGNTFGPPVKVANFYDLPDCATYTGYDLGRACVPTAPLGGHSIFRAADYPSGVARSPHKIVITFGSYINRHSNPTRGNCAPNGLSTTTFLNLYTGVGNVNGCNNDIVVSTSTDGGKTFTGTTTSVARLRTASDEGAVLADQWWQWSARTPLHHVATSYYDRKYGTDQRTGRMDFTLLRGNGSHVRVTDFSLPPSNEFPDVNGYSTFLGDYTGLAIGSDGMAHPAWADTRNPIQTFSPTSDPRNLVNAGHGADIYTRSLHS